MTGPQDKTQIQQRRAADRLAEIFPDVDLPSGSVGRQSQIVHRSLDLLTGQGDLDLDVIEPLGDAHRWPPGARPSTSSAARDRTSKLPRIRCPPSRTAPRDNWALIVRVVTSAIGAARSPQSCRVCGRRSSEVGGGLISRQAKQSRMIAWLSPALNSWSERISPRRTSW